MRRALLTTALFLLLALVGGAAQAQVALDAKVTAVKSLSWSHTVNGSNLVLVVGVAINSSGGVVSSMNWTPSGGSAVALSCRFAANGGGGGACGGSGSSHRAEIWGAPLGNFSSKAGTVAFTLSSGTASTVVAGSVSLTGASQSSPFGTAQGRGGLDSSVSLTFSGLNSLGVIVDALSISTDQQPSTLGTGQSSLWSGATATSGGTYGQGSMMGSSNNGGTVSQSWSGGTTHDAYVAVPINPAPPAGRKGQTIVGRLEPIRGTVVPVASVN